MKVSVLMVTYNHERYIAEAIESILCQKTNYKYELIIGNDASTDKTGEIIDNYAAQYPNIIKVFHTTENKGGQYNHTKILNASNSEYFMHIDGDDMWVDDSKIQQQVDFMDANPEYSIHFQRCIIIDQHSNFVQIQERNNFGDISQTDFWWYYLMSTSKIHRRSFLLHPPACILKVNCGDLCLGLAAAQNGKIYYSPEVTAAYRITPHGIWAGSSPLKQKLMTVSTLLHCFFEFGIYDIQNTFPAICTHCHHLNVFIEKHPTIIVQECQENTSLNKLLQDYYQMVLKLNVFIKENEHLYDFQSFLERSQENFAKSNGGYVADLGHCYGMQL